MIKQIEKAIKKMIGDTIIRPNMIKMHPIDIHKLEGLMHLKNSKIKKIFGLEVIEDLYLKEGTALVYNNKFVIELTEEDLQGGLK